MLWTIAVLTVVASQVHGHSYHSGNCPVIKAMDNFDINQFLGTWYVIQKSSTRSSCLVNNYSKNENKTGHYKIEQLSESMMLGLLGKDNKYHYTGDLVIPDPAKAANMRVRFPLSVAGGATYTVFMTDYVTYAGVFSCQKLAFSHRRSASILSRTKTLDQAHINKLREELDVHGIDSQDLSIIKQNNCSDHIAHRDNVPSVFRKAGEAIEEGFKAVVESVKNVYTNFRADHGKESKDFHEGADMKDNSDRNVYTNLRADHGKQSKDFHEERDMKDDAEWLP